jgi:thioredoxin 1
LTLIKKQDRESSIVQVVVYCWLLGVEFNFGGKKLVTTITGIIAWVKLNLVLVLFLAVVAGAFVFLRTTATKIDDPQELSSLLRDGQPTVIEFYSNFCAACLVAKPIVDGLEEDLTGTAKVIRLDVLSSVGRQAAIHFGVRGTPTLIVVDNRGQVTLTQIGVVRSGPVREQVEQLVVSTAAK